MFGVWYNGPRCCFTKINNSPSLLTYLYHNNKLNIPDVGNLKVVPEWYKEAPCYVVHLRQ